MAYMPEAVLDVQGLSKYFPAGGGRFRGAARQVHAVEEVSFRLARGQILALVGESGSGKSTIARLIAGMYPATAGQVRFHDQDVLALRGRSALLAYRRKVQMVFQDPFGSLNPVKTIAHHLERPLSIQRRLRGAERREVLLELLRTVGLTPPEEVAAKYPYQLSGGQRQRVSFARALAVDPEIILADEPISMLDVSIRMGILNLMAGLRDERGLSYLYITHDLASARYIADDTLVLYAGHLVESGPSEAVMAGPLHPYTALLLSAVPDPRAGLTNKRVEARGEIPTVIDPKPGCRFANRCPYVMEVCRAQTPPLIPIDARPERRVRCHLYTPQSTGSQLSAEQRSTVASSPPAMLSGGSSL